MVFWKKDMLICNYHKILGFVPLPTRMSITKAAGVASITITIQDMRSTVMKQAVIKTNTRPVLSEKEGAKTMNSHVRTC